jgi:hypothetical protein
MTIPELQALDNDALNRMAAEVMGCAVWASGLRHKISASDGRTHYCDGVIVKWEEDGPVESQWNPTDKDTGHNDAAMLMETIKQRKLEDAFVRHLFWLIEQEVYAGPDSGLDNLWDFANASPRDKTIAAIAAVDGVK